MAVRLYEWDKNEVGGTAIEVTANKVINLLLRSEDNLLKLDDNELYCDLQLEDWIATTDTLPVWVTTGRVLAADWWVATWTMLCFKTTSWDYVEWIYGDDWKLYVDNGTWTFKQVYLKSEVDALFVQLRSEISAVGFSWEYSDLLHKPTLWTAAACDTWTSEWEIPVVQANGKLPSSVIPVADPQQVFTVTTANDLTTLSNATQWDYGIVTDESKTYILSSDPYSTLSNWIELPSPTWQVSSVNWKTGSVTLTTTDISEWDTSHQYVTSGEKNTWNAKLWTNDVATVALTWNYNDLSNAPTLTWNVFVTQAWYDSLPSSKLTDWMSYFIFNN